MFYGVHELSRALKFDQRQNRKGKYGLYWRFVANHLFPLCKGLFTDKIQPFKEGKK
jgi:hypothetical protein